MTKEELAEKWGKYSDKPIKLEWVGNTLTMANNPKEEFLSDLNEFLEEMDVFVVTETYRGAECDLKYVAGVFETLELAKDAADILEDAQKRAKEYRYEYTYENMKLITKSIKP